MSSVSPENNGLMQGDMEYKSGMRKRTNISIILGVFLAVALTAFITILVIYLKGQYIKELGNVCNEGIIERFAVAIDAIGFLCETRDTAEQANCLRCARILDDRAQCEAESSGLSPLCTFDTTRRLCIRL
ncbi:uncharacterized protein LOC133186442 isoform X1 [Saccostrea echinata]|uniref:uncharacterized protein LOC133186442 isoform X1 n=1 Tax=Saccostrea echinata TaxID=191078 RepID=UPI002A8142B6|nr:uncharacterized protein LOC133186442 isoform X1 [Saccostrea echinata]